MYLKALEILGFKSFADRTRLTFEPGMIAIVGPNGCGKSNVSDAIRWVLGEQRPSALRCAKMQDVIFNGTDARKPLGMAEVTLVFAECEATLGTEHDEVSITRRAYRDGANAYFLNKTPCRLRDIQRLFMGTGVGTTSYSVMAQGQIDAILSSRPEDRRAVFEEAAGITKFRADRREALRKIAQTEENLARVTDLLGELRRQAAQLRRQAEKAEKARALRAELRGIDLYQAKKRVAAWEEAIATHGLAVAEAAARIQAIQGEAEAGERAIASANARIQAGEDAIAKLSEEAAASAARHAHAQENVQTNLARIAEYRAWADGLRKEIDDAKARLAQAEAEQDDAPDTAALDDEQETLQGLLDDAQAAFDARKAALDAARATLQEARDGLARLDRQQLLWQQEVARADAGREARLLKRERLAAEAAEAERQAAERAEAKAQTEAAAEAARERAAETRDAVIALDEDRSFVADDLAAAAARRAARDQRRAALEARRDLLARPVPGERPDAGPRLLDPDCPLALAPGDVLGPLAEGLEAPPEALRRAVEAALAPWARAWVVRSAAVARAILAQAPALWPDAALQLLAAEPPPAEPPAPDSLAAAVTARPGYEGLLARLLGAWRVADDVPAAPEGVACVTRAGDRLYATGGGETRATGEGADPIARRLACDAVEAELAALGREDQAEEGETAALQARMEAFSAKLRDTQRTLEKAMREANQAEGAQEAAARDAAAAEARRAETAARLAEAEAEAGRDDDAAAEARKGLEGLAAERERLTVAASAATDRLPTAEGEVDEASARLSEARFRMAALAQRREHLLARRREREARRRELAETLSQREASILGCEGNVARLEADNARILGSLDGLEAETQALQARIAEARAARQELNDLRTRLEAASATARRTLQEAQEAKGREEVAMAEARALRQALLDRLAHDYAIDPAHLPDEPCAAWPEGEAPDDAWCDARMADLREGLERIGPVNLLAIDEHRQVEERAAFYQAQSDDLTRSRDELLTLIRTLNETSGKRFRETFAHADANFRAMFTRLFNGGEARLALIENAEDPLECGIDIIARPPGKKPQTISLLSGGERTMTAVSLLFAIFLIKPAPFCLLDELDAALDDSNIGRFVDALKDFLVHSQFLIITHNQHTIAGSDIVYGVTMPEKGVSRTLSMRFTRDRRPDFRPDAPTPQEPRP